MYDNNRCRKFKLSSRDLPGTDVVVTAARVVDDDVRSPGTVDMEISDSDVVVDDVT